MLRTLWTPASKRAWRDWALVCLVATTLFGVYSELSPVADRWVQKLRTRRPTRPEIMTGGIVSVAGVTFDRAPLNVVLITSPKCEYCVASAGFHRKLSEKAQSKKVPFYIAVPSIRGAETYVRDAGLVGPVKTWDDLSFGFRGTPTVLLIDDHNAVRATLVGKLPAAAEPRVLRILDHPEELASVNGLDGRQSINGDELKLLGTKRRVSLIDVRERNEFGVWHKEGAINIPLLEFDIRAPFELDKATDQVIDCSQFSFEACASIIRRVQQRGFTAIPFAQGFVFDSCQITPHGS